MKKIELKEDVSVMCVGIIPKGTTFKVEKFNKRFVYVKYLGCTLRLLRSGVNVIY